MSDLNIQTRPRPLDDSACEVDISADWKVWGPNGGYLSALVLRAVGTYAPEQVPASYAGQYLQVPAFGKARIEVETVRRTRCASAWSARLVQDGAVMLQAQVWTCLPGSGLEHQILAPPGHFRPLAQAGSRPPAGDMRMWQNLEIRQVRNDSGHYGHWYRFVPEPDIEDVYVDAARSLVLIDTMQWPARYYMEETPPAWVAPSLDLYVQFHRFNARAQWLYSDAMSMSACDGLIAGCATVWDDAGRLLASGGSQSALRPVRAAA